jgi:hypothetical protein
MARQDWHDLEEQRRRGRLRDDYGQADYSDDYGYDPRRRSGYRAEEDSDRDDFGQVDYSTTYAYDADRRQGYRRYSHDDPDYTRRMNDGDDRRSAQPRSWIDRAGEFLSPSDRRFRRGPSDRAIWAMVMDRLDHEPRLDLRDVEVRVENAEVTLNGSALHKMDKRRIEDLADVDGVRHVQNNLRVRGGWF